MVTFQVNYMTCGRCVSVIITKALKAADRAAEVTIDLAQHHGGAYRSRSARTAVVAMPAKTGGCCG